MAGMVDTEVRRLVVTGPARDQLFEHFSRLFYGHDDVVVMKDRRHGDRRCGEAAGPQERRTRDRRRRPPDWVVPPTPRSCSVVRDVAQLAASAAPVGLSRIALTSAAEHRRGGMWKCC